MLIGSSAIGSVAAGGRYDISLRGFPRGGSEHAYERARAAAVPPGPVQSVALLRELDAVAWVFPNDRKLDLPRLDAEGLADSTALPVARASLVAYAPEKSATARLEDETGRAVAYAKVYAGEEAERTAFVHEALAGPPVRIPRVLAVSPPSRLLVLEAVAGRRLASLRGDRLEDALCGLGSAVATLHGMPPLDGERFTRLEPGRLAVATDLIARARPDLAGLARALANDLARLDAEPPEPLVCLHGDLHPGNAIFGSEGVALIDLDQVAAGDPAAELGSLLAWLRCARIVGDLDAARERKAAASFLEGYESIRALPPPDSLRRQLGLALVAERAVRGINRMRPPVLAQLGALIVEARRLLRASRG